MFAVNKLIALEIWLIVSWVGDVDYVRADGGCEDIQSLMDNTVREDCSAAGLMTRGGSICVPRSPGPLLVFVRRLSSQPLAMRSFNKPQDEQLLIGYYPKMDKCFLITRTECQIKGATVDPYAPRMFWIEICPPIPSSSPDAYSQRARVTLHRMNLDGSGHEWSPFADSLESWYNIDLVVDSTVKKIYAITYHETLECDLAGSNCVSFDRPSEGTLLASRIEQ